MTDNSRREFIKGAAFLGSTALLATQLPSLRSALSFMGRQQESGKLLTYSYPYNEPANYINSTCLQCHIGCQIRVKSLDGVVVKTDGNPYTPQTRLPPLNYETSLADASRRD